MSILVDIIHGVKEASFLWGELLTDAVYVGDGLDDLAGLPLVVVVLVNLGFELLLEVGVHPGDVRDVSLQSRYLLLLLEEFFLQLSKLFSLESGDGFHLVVYQSLALL